MRIIRRRGWEIAESQVTPESAVLNRRTLLGGTAALLGAASAAMPERARAAPNPKYVAGRPLTDEKYATTYNNYYEFSESKNLWQQAPQQPASRHPPGAKGGALPVAASLGTRFLDSLL